MTKRDYPTIRCADCGHEAKAPNKQTKYCSTCRLAKQAAWHDGRLLTCGCGAEYVSWPGTGHGMMRTCGTCFEAASSAGGRESVPGHCNLCERDDVPLFTQHMRVCYPCLQSPANMAKVKAGIASIHQRLTARKN